VNALGVVCGWLVLAVLMVMAVAMGECKWAVLCVAVSDKRADHRARRMIVTTVRVVAPPPHPDVHTCRRKSS
jgi:hypothetical protein